MDSLYDMITKLRENTRANRPMDHPPTEVMTVHGGPIPCISMLQRPTMSYAEVDPDKMTFFIKRFPNDVPIHSYEIRNFILFPQSVVHNYNLKKLFMKPKEGGEEVPAHLPNIEELRSISPQIASVVQDWMQQQPIHSSGIFSDLRELLYLVDPSPTLSPLRSVYSLTLAPTKLITASYTDSVVIFQSVQRIKELEVQMKIGCNCQSEIELIPKAEVSDFVVGQEVGIELPTMSIVAWNCRSVYRPSFETNLMHIINVHSPDIILLTETRGFTIKLPSIVLSQSIYHYHVVDGIGFSRGFMVMWKESFLNYSTLEHYCDEEEYEDKNPDSVQMFFMVQNIKYGEL
ncbi:hypothetical protein SOVF_207200 [Spinacia oleracea]|nr:hypothetical protein SOVF_207200 [Spinacia oleracea]